MAIRWRRRSPLIARANAASGAPASSSRNRSAARPAARRCASQPTPDRLFLTRVLTAAVLLAAFLAALFWLEREWFAMVAAIVVGLGAHEWAKLIRTDRVVGMVYAAACAGVCYSLARNAELAPGVCALAGLFWIAAAPYLLGRGIRPAPIGAGLAGGIRVLGPPRVALGGVRAGQAPIDLGVVLGSGTCPFFRGGR